MGGMQHILLISIAVFAGLLRIQNTVSVIGLTMASDDLPIVCFVLERDLEANELVWKT